MTKTWAMLLTMMYLWSIAPQALGQDHTLADRYLERQIAVWKQDSSSKDIEALGELFAEGAVYTHPRVGIIMEGRATILGAMQGFLGTSRLPQASDVEVLAGEGVLVLGFNLSMEVRGDNGWMPIKRRQLIVLEVSNGLITRVSDYW